jgi:hypothetical protein
MVMDHFREHGTAVSVGGVTIENGVGTMVIHGSQVLRPDADTLVFLRALRARIDMIEAAILAGVVVGRETDVPATVGSVDNPFL